MVLLTRRINTGWADGQLGIPGGHLEPGETARQAAAREIAEELGVSIDIKRLKFFASVNLLTNHDYILYEFAVELKPEEQPTILEPDRISELVWCNPKQLPDDVPSSFRAIIENGYNNGKTYLEIGY
jgi:8-oxo-dGTP diphosphatase